MKCSRLTMLNAFLKSILRRPSAEPLCLLSVAERMGHYLYSSFAPHTVVLTSKTPTNFLLTCQAETLADEATDWVPASKRTNRGRRFLKGDRYTTCNERDQKFWGGTRGKMIHTPCQL